MTIRFMYDNLIDSATLTESSEATGFPAENVQHPFRTKVWTTSGATAGTANLVIDHGSAKAVTCVVLAGYDWTSAPGTLDLEFNATDSWDSPSHTEALTWAANPTSNGNKGVIVKCFSSQSYRYNRLNVVYSPGGTPTDWSLGRIFLGTYFEPTYGRLANEIYQDFIDLSYVNSTPQGYEHVDEIDVYRTKNFAFMVQSQSQWESFQSMINNVGKFKNLFIAFDYSNEPDEMTWYGRFTEIPRAQRHPTGNAYKIRFSFKEVM